MASILYLGTDEGVVTLKSEDGRSWKTEHHGLKDWQVPEVAVSASAPNKVFAGTRGDGVWLSEDFGATWSKPCYGKRGPGKVRCLTIDPRDADTRSPRDGPLLDVPALRRGGDASLFPPRSSDADAIRHLRGRDPHHSLVERRCYFVYINGRRRLEPAVHLV